MLISSSLESKLVSLSALLVIVLERCNKEEASEPPGRINEFKADKFAL